MENRVWVKNYPAGVRPTLEYPDISLGQMLDQTVAKAPDHVAMIFAGREITYGQFGVLANRFANALAKLGVKKGDRIAIMGPNCPQWEIAFFGTLKLGGIVVQTSPMYTERELSFQLKDAGATGIVVLDALYPRVKAVREETGLKVVVTFSFQGQKFEDEGVYDFDTLIAQAEATPPQVEINPAEDIAVLQYTGGTTGVSKGVMLTHRNLVVNCYQIIEWSVNAEFGKERVLTALPIFHVYGMSNCVNYAVAVASTQIIVPRFEVDEILEAIKKYKPTSFPGAPAMYIAINNHPRAAEYAEALAEIKYCISGSAPLPVEVAEQFKKVTNGRVDIVEGYGLSEASPVTHCNPVDRPSRPGSIGVPMPDTDCVIMDLETGTKPLPPGEIGELCIRGPQVMKGYWNKPEETAIALRDGWLYTGDIAKMDEDGYFYIVDRKKDMILASGFNVYPREIEEVLYEHPKVKEAAVAGIPDPKRGETVKAYIVLQPGAEATEEEIIAYCRTKLAAYKVPRYVEFRDSLPRTAVGKLLRRLLVEEEKAKMQTAAAQGGQEEK